MRVVLRFVVSLGLLPCAVPAGAQQTPQRMYVLQTAEGPRVMALDTAGPVPQTVEVVEKCQPGTRTQQPGPPGPQARGAGYDVVLEVPDLCVRRIHLVVRGVDAHLALNARVANLVRLEAGADVYLKAVDLTISGVQAEALVLVDLGNVVYIVDRTMQFLDNNPQVIAGVFRTVRGAVGTVGNVANVALQPGGVVSQTVDVLGQTLDEVTRPGGFLSRTVDAFGRTVIYAVDTAGRLVEHTADTAGRIVGENVVGHVLDLPLLSASPNAAGQSVRRVRDQAGNVIEFVVDAAGVVSGARVVQAAGIQGLR